MSPAALAASGASPSPSGSSAGRRTRRSPSGGVKTGGGGARGGRSGSDLIEFSFRGPRDVSTGINLQLVKTPGRTLLEIKSIDPGTAAAHNELLCPGLVLVELQ